MAETSQRASISLNNSDIDQLQWLQNYYGENRTSIIRRAIILLHYITFKDKNNDGK